MVAVDGAVLLEPPTQMYLCSSFSDALYHANKELTCCIMPCRSGIDLADDLPCLCSKSCENILWSCRGISETVIDQANTALRTYPTARSRVQGMAAEVVRCCVCATCVLLCGVTACSCGLLHVIWCEEGRCVHTDPEGGYYVVGADGRRYSVE